MPDAPDTALPDDLNALCRRAVERLTGGFDDGRAQILVGVSGGADSVALLLILHGLWPGRICAVTVDHQLRTAAADEARFVAQLCAGRSIPHTILHPSVPITGNIQSSARTARYALLKEHARSHDCQWIATAHHADDQLETMLMRLARGSGLDGLSAIRPRNGNVIRPLLEVRKERLLAFCRQAGIDPVSDPSNADAQYDRVRMRNALRHFDAVDPLAAVQSAAALAEAREAIEWTVDKAISDYVRIEGDRVLLANIDFPREILRRLLLYCVRKIQPDLMPRGDAVARALDALENGQKTMIGDVICRTGTDTSAQHFASPQWRFEAAPPRGAK